jgi:MtN3 and saliva related transmembrane protein
MLAAGVGFWIGYGIFIGDLPVILFNAVTLTLVTVIIALKIKFK